MKSTEFKRAVLGSPPVELIGVHNGLGARLAEEAGFDGLWASGLEISTAAAVPDANILTMTEFLDAAIEVNQAARLPVVADVDTGFGNSNNVMHLVRRYEAAGIAAVAIEDKRFPKVNSFVPGRQELAPVAEFAGKLLAAKSAQETEDFMVIARIEALIAGWGEDEALRRAEAYVDAGADAILIHSKQPTPEEVLSFLKRWDRRSPVVIVPTTYPGMTAREWADEGVNVVIYANHGLRAAIGAMADVFARIKRDRTSVAVEEDIAPLRRVFELQGMIDLKQQEKKFLRTGERNYRAVIPAGGDLTVPDDLKRIVGDDLPRTLLDVAGKPVIQRQVEALERAGIQDVTLVADVDHGPVLPASVRAVRYSGPGPLASIAKGLEQLDPDGSTTLICYSDILFGTEVVDTLTRVDDDLAVLGDRSSVVEGRATSKQLDYLVVDPAPEDGVRDLNPRRRYRVTRIGKDVDPAVAHFEFIGFTVLSPDGLRLFMDEYRRLAETRAGEPFGRAATFEEASLTDFLQHLVDAGHEVAAHPQMKGWTEIHEFADWKLAIEQTGQGQA